MIKATLNKALNVNDPQEAADITIKEALANV